jgi:hypothetical protein
MRKLAILALGAAILGAAGARAATLARMKLPELARASAFVVQARCLEVSSRWEGGEIWTFSRFETLSSWKGKLPAEFAVRMIGGQVGEIESLVSGVPRFAPGEEAVLFLVPTVERDYAVTAWTEGTFRVRRDALGHAFVTQESAAELVFHPSTRSFAARGIRRMPLAAFHRLFERVSRASAATSNRGSRAPQPQGAP